MAMEIWSGVCLDGPLDGHFHRQITVPPIRGGVFNYIGLAGVRGSYRYSIFNNGWVFGPWIEEHPPGSTEEGRRLHEQYDGNGRPRP